MSIRRVWHGWTTPANADAYERVLRTEVIPGIEKEIGPIAAFDPTAPANAAA